MKKEIKVGDLVRAKYSKPSCLYEVKEINETTATVEVLQQWHEHSKPVGHNFDLRLELIEVAN